jgi:hypothetical protein
MPDTTRHLVGIMMNNGDQKQIFIDRRFHGHNASRRQRVSGQACFPSPISIRSNLALA